MAIRGAMVGGGLISNMTGQIALNLVVMIPELMTICMTDATLAADGLSGC